ncbi:M96 mating-specific protein [Phytophthora megakarya]|uniref:M96 mating-specific protein n=1 Tax=Phytophthora megakarya TaxID=4795 RepID=A0A225VEN9_9STRA|nr:M96 mating-specific protein [Phytophthora megakarya]
MATRALHPTEDLLVSASYDDTIHTWAENDDDWYCKETLTGHTNKDTNEDGSEYGLAVMTISPVNVHIHEDIDGTYIEFFTYKKLSFDVREIPEVSWEHCKGKEKHTMGNGGVHQKTAKELYSNTARADVQVKQVVRRYAEADQDIITWVARLTPTEIKHKILRGPSGNQKVSTIGDACAPAMFSNLPDKEARLRYDPSSLRALPAF